MVPFQTSSTHSTIIPSQIRWKYKYTSTKYSSQKGDQNSCSPFRTHGVSGNIYFAAAKETKHETETRRRHVSGVIRRFFL